MIDYRSDNTGRAAPQILEALVRANHDTALGYGADEWTANLQRRFSDLFETAVRVFPVATGTPPMPSPLPRSARPGASSIAAKLRISTLPRRTLRGSSAAASSWLRSAGNTAK